MSIETLTPPKLVRTDAFAVDPKFKIRIARADEDEELRNALWAGHFEVQAGGYTAHHCQLYLVGAGAQPRSVASLNLDLIQFEEVVRYNPAAPPADEFFAKQMLDYHARTQADFEGAKKRNLIDYTAYGLEALRGERKANIPEINGWFDVEASKDTLFVVLHAPEPDVFYGQLFLPSVNPVMQADGQTQAAMLFKLARTKYGAPRRSQFRVKLEVEFGLTPEEAGQAFADRNGRGVKKNRNLVADLTTVGGLATIMKKAIPGTIFEGRTFNGRGQGISETSTTMIIDLATLEQVVLNACTYGTRRPEHIKDMHVDTYLPVVRDFLGLLERVFGSQWPKDTPPGADQYRKIYVHGWSFAFKALARAYYRTRIDELGPLAEAMRRDDLDTVSTDNANAWRKRADRLAAADAKRPAGERRFTPPISTKQFEHRLRRIDWVRHRKHWVDLTHFTRDATTGKPNVKTLADGTIVIKAKAPTQKEVIAGIEGTILGPDWKTLCGKEDFDWRKAA
ncbi:MAG: hypothetical protein M3340_03625 [Actinomycetota bacterium]|nr:hypothetical protein [Actinomycetota bacterium]